MAVHNDYRLNGTRYSFWLLTHPSGVWCKGEGVTEEQALRLARTQAAERLAWVEGKGVPPVSVASEKPVEAPAPIQETEEVRRDFAKVSEECAESIQRGGKQLSYEKWEPKDWLKWYGRLKAKRMPGCVEPPASFNVRETTCIRRLVLWLKPREARKFLEWIVQTWKPIRTKYRINGTATIQVVWGFRENLVADFKTGAVAEKDFSRTHRSGGPTEGKNKKAVGWNNKL